MTLPRRFLPFALLLLACAAAPAQPDPHATVITISRTGHMTLRLDGRTHSIKPARLTATLLAAGNPAERTVYIKASPAATVGVVQDVLDRVQKAGITKVSIVDPR